LNPKTIGNPISNEGISILPGSFPFVNAMSGQALEAACEAYPPSGLVMAITRILDSECYTPP